MTMKYRLRLLCAGLLFCSMQSAAAQETVQTLSPNGKLAITVSLQDGAPRYEVTYQGKPVVLESALGINGNGDWSRGMRIAGVTRSSRDTLWTPVYGERSEIPDRYNQSVIRFAHGKREPGLELEVRAYDEGAAFRYLFLEGGGYLHITGEATEFTLPEGTMAYFAPFAQAVHQKLPLHDWPGEADRPLTLELPGGLYGALAEPKWSITSARNSTLPTGNPTRWPARCTAPSTKSRRSPRRGGW